MYDSDFWKQPVYQHWRAMLETGRQFPYPGTTDAATGEVLSSSTLLGSSCHQQR